MKAGGGTYAQRFDLMRNSAFRSALKRMENGGLTHLASRAEAIKSSIPLALEFIILRYWEPNKRRHEKQPSEA